MKWMEKKKLTIANEESKDGPEDHSGPSQGSTNRMWGRTNNHSGSEPGLEFSFPSSVANSSAHALVHALQEEEEESDSELFLLSNVVSSRPHALPHVLREEKESKVSSQEITLVEDPDQLTIDDQSRGDSEAERIGLGEDVTSSNEGLQVWVHPAMALLDELRCAIPPEPPCSAVDNVLDILNNQTMLCGVQNWLAGMGKDKNIDILFQACIVSMVGTLNLFLDPEITCTWRQASLVSSKVQGHGITHAQYIWEWILKYVLHNELPLHRLGQTRWNTLEDEDVAQEIKLRVSEKLKGRHLTASNVIDVVASPEVQAVLTQKGIFKPTISEHMVWHWLAGLGWQYRKTPNGMYIDGHERDNVVEYCHGFISHWKQYELHFHKWDNDGNELP
jgi:hypothetical protein